MTPTKEVPTWEELVERMAAHRYRVNCDPEVFGGWSTILEKHREEYREEIREGLRAAGLTPEILEDARAVAIVRQKGGTISYNPDDSELVRWEFATHPVRADEVVWGSTLREAVAKAKEEGYA